MNIERIKKESRGTQNRTPLKTTINRMAVIQKNSSNIE